MPALPTNRAYLKALRQAEMAAWESAPVKATPSKQVTPRLPSTARHAGEGWLYAFLTALCAALVGHELWSLFQASGSWQNFVQYVRQLLA